MGAGIPTLLLDIVPLDLNEAQREDPADGTRSERVSAPRPTLTLAYTPPSFYTNLLSTLPIIPTGPQCGYPISLSKQTSGPASQLSLSR